MIPRTKLPPGLIALADHQSGAISREQLLGHGVSDRVIARLLAEGRFERICRGVYATRSGGFLQRTWAGVLIGGPGAVVGLEAAAFLTGIVRKEPDEVAVFTTTHLRRRDSRWRFIESARRGSGEPPRTRPAQTVVDLAAMLGEDEVVTILAEVVGRGRARAADVLGVLAATSRHPRRALVTDLLNDVVAGSHSPLELRYARQVERAHGLPHAQRQAGPVAGYRTDCWYSDYGLVVELDGKAYHSGAHALDDMDRDNAHLLAGVVTLRFGWRQVAASPCAVAATVAGALRRAGWQGTARPCPSCRPVQHRTFRT